MGKNRTNKKTWTRTDRNKLIERGMRDEDVYHPTELKERKKRIAMIMRMQDQKLRKEEDDRERRGTCPICYTYLTTTGICPLGRNHIRKGDTK